MNQRRESMAHHNHNFSKLFPFRKANHGMRVRNSERFHVKITKSERHQDSAVPFKQAPPGHGSDLMPSKCFRA